jgi:cytochrome oxidase Cu insertion factor (SCO1/SenC/PrrC family)
MIYTITENLPESHSNMMYLVDQRGYLRQFYNGTTQKDVDLLRYHIDKLLNTF